MTYNEFINLQIGDLIEIRSKDIAYGDSCVMIVINKEITRVKRPLDRNEYRYFCKIICPSRLEKLATYYNDTSIILQFLEYISDFNEYESAQYGFVDDKWEIGYLKNVPIDDLNIFKGDI